MLGNAKMLFSICRFVESAGAKPTATTGGQELLGGKSGSKWTRALQTCGVQESTTFPSLLWEAVAFTMLGRGCTPEVHKRRSSEPGIPPACGLWRHQHEAVMVSEKLSGFFCVTEKEAA